MTSQGTASAVPGRTTVGPLSLPPSIAHPERQPQEVAAVIALVTALNPAMDGLGPSTAVGLLPRLPAAMLAGTSTNPPRRSRSTRI